MKPDTFAGRQLVLAPPRTRHSEPRLHLVCPQCKTGVYVHEDKGAWCSGNGRHVTLRMVPA